MKKKTTTTPTATTRTKTPATIQVPKAEYKRLKELLLATTEAIENSHDGRKSDPVAKAHLAVAQKSRKLLATAA